MKSWPAWTALIGVAIAVIVLFSLLMNGNAAPDPMVGQTASPVRVTVMARDDASDAEGPVRLLNFWATWCTPCKIEHPVLVDLAASGVRIEGVAYRDDPAKIAIYLDRAGNPFSTLYLDPDGETTFDYGVGGVPETFVIGPDDVIRARVSGYISPEALNTIILPALDPAWTPDALE